MEDLSRYRQRIVDDALDTFKGANTFSGYGSPAGDLAMAACEGMLDLLMEPEESRDPHVVEIFIEWLYNLIRKQSLKADTTIEFLDTFESIVKKPLNNKEDQDVKAFFDLCRQIVREKHKKFTR